MKGNGEGVLEVEDGEVGGVRGNVGEKGIGIVSNGYCG